MSNGLRAAHSAHRCCGLLLGLLLALVPVAQSLVAAQGPCGRMPLSETTPATVKALSLSVTETQWTCSGQEPVSVIRALPSDRPDGPSSGDAGTSFEDDTRSRHAPSQRTGPGPVRPSISPVLAALRPVVLQI
jgi:hypothetical protein